MSTKSQTADMQTARKDAGHINLNSEPKGG